MPRQRHAMIDLALVGVPAAFFGWWLGRSSSGPASGTLWLAAGAGAAATGLAWIAWEKRRRRQESRDMARHLAEAMDRSRAAVVILNRSGKIEYVNQGLCSQIGYAPVDLLHRRWQDLEVAWIGRKGRASLLTALRDSQQWEGEWISRRQDGTVRPVRGTVMPLRTGSGARDSLYVVVFEDMTEAKAREAELRQARDQAQAADLAKGRFLATMSHEVRTPLNGIVGFTSLLLDTSLSAEQREYVQTIRLSAEALIQLTSDILDFARIEAGKLKVEAEAIDPRECAEEAIDLHAARAAEKDIELLHHFAPDVPSTIITDGGRLRQILVNLIGNAVKFTERGEVEIGVRRLPATAPGEGPAEPERIEFSVRDTGIGIAKGDQLRLFRPFSQIDESSTRRHGGAGLGLAICRNLVELMGGSIGLVSELGKGSTFRFTLPATGATPAPPPHNLAGVRVALSIRSTSLHRELVDLIRGWGGAVVEAKPSEQLAPDAADIALMEVDEALARELAARPTPTTPFTPARLFGLVPVSLPSDLRPALRKHFRLLVNKPVHHDAFFALLAGSWGGGSSPQPPAHFGFRVLVVDQSPVNQQIVHRVLAGLDCTATMVADGKKALDLLAQRASTFDLVLLNLPAPAGAALARAIRAGHAGEAARPLWLIGLRVEDPSGAMTPTDANSDFNDLLEKPLRLTALEMALHRFQATRDARRG